MSRAPIRKGRLLALPLGVILLILGGTLVFAAVPQTVWLDAPLDGSSFDVGAKVAIVGHVTDPGGVEAARVQIDGERLDRTDITTGPGELTTVEFVWEPSDPGTHVVGLWARTADGWQGPALATVFVKGEAPPPPTSSTTTSSTTTSSTTTSSTTTSSTTTSSTTTPTEPPCEFAAPDPVSPVNGRTTPLTANTLSWSYSGCRLALDFQVEVSTTPTFLEIFASATVTGTTDWVTPHLACDTYYWRVRPQVFDAVGPWSAPWSYTISFRGC